MAKFSKLESGLSEIEYIDIRPIYIAKLSAYPKGLTPKRGETVKVTENEKKKLLNQKNGKNPCWKEVRKRQEPKAETIKSEES